MGLSGYFNDSEDDLQPVDAADEEEQQRLRMLAAGPPADKPAWWKPPTDIPAPRPIEDAVAPESIDDTPSLPNVAAPPTRYSPEVPNPAYKKVENAQANVHDTFAAKPVPKEPKWWQRALAGAAGFGAGYYNAEGKAGHIDPSAAIDTALGGPGNRKREEAWKHNVQTAELGLQGAQNQRDAWFKKYQEEEKQRLEQAQEGRLDAQAKREAGRNDIDLQKIKQGDAEKQDALALKGRDDAYLLEPGKTAPLGWDTIPSKANPSRAYAAPPRFVKLPPALAQYAPGREIGQLVPYGEFKRAQDAAGKSAELYNSKPDPAAKENEQMWIATLNSPTSTPEQKRTARANLNEAAAQKKAGAAPPPDRGQNFIDPATGQLVRVEPGQMVPKGAMTSSTFSTQNAPTMQMRNVGAQAALVHEQTPHMLSEIDRLGPKLGPVMGRWNEFYQGKVGMEDPEFAGLRADLLMYASAVALMHARGRLPENLRAEFDHAINAPKQSPANLKAVISRIDSWTAQNMKAMGGGQNQQDPLGIR